MRQTGCLITVNWLLQRAKSLLDTSWLEVTMQKVGTPEVDGAPANPHP